MEHYERMARLVGQAPDLLAIAVAIRKTIGVYVTVDGDLDAIRLAEDIHGHEEHPTKVGANLMAIIHAADRTVERATSVTPVLHTDE